MDGNRENSSRPFSPFSPSPPFAKGLDKYTPLGYITIALAVVAVKHFSASRQQRERVDGMDSTGKVKNVVNVFDDAANTRYCYSG